MHILTQTSSSKVYNWQAPHLSGLLKKLKWNPQLLCIGEQFSRV